MAFKTPLVCFYGLLKPSVTALTVSFLLDSWPCCLYFGIYNTVLYVVTFDLFYLAAPWLVSMAYKTFSHGQHSWFFVVQIFGSPSGLCGVASSFGLAA